MSQEDFKFGMAYTNTYGQIVYLTESNSWAAGTGQLVRTPKHDLVPREVADKLASALRPFAQFHCDPLGDCYERTGDDMCPNCEAQKALSEYEATNTQGDE